ncbi:MAG: DUF434 domain-containing protein [Syntrophobacteraceae bacterium]
MEKRRWLVFQAAGDFFFLQNRLYPRSSALEWVGNRYELTHMERMLLHRGVFGQEQALLRRAKRSRGADWLEGLLAVDGHNVQITVESFILGRPLLLANDGAVRDLAGLSAKFRFSEISEMALDMIFRHLEEFRPKKILFLFDAPMSHSGFLASKYQQRLKTIGLKGEARAVPVPEREIPYRDSCVASSDQEILDKATRWLDLARTVIDAAGPLELHADFSSIILAKAPDRHSLENVPFYCTPRTSGE